jgi:hypothetical protein
VRTHQALDTAAPNVLTLIAQRRMHPRAAVDLAVVLVHRANLLNQAFIFLRSGAGLPAKPGIEAGSASGRLWL